MSDLDRCDDRLAAEKFTPSDLMGLRSDLMQCNLDSFLAAEVLTTFLSGRGYGISSQEARHVASRIEGKGCKPEHIQRELELVARVM